MAKKKREKSLAKATGLKSTFTIKNGELLMTSFGKGSEALIQKRIINNEINDVQVEKDPAFSVYKAANDKSFRIQGRKIKSADEDLQKKIDKKVPITNDPRCSKKRLPGMDLIGAKGKLEERYFGKTFEDNIHIQLIYRILDINKTLAVHVNNIVYTLDNLFREKDSEFYDFVGIGYISNAGNYESYCNPNELDFSDHKAYEHICESHRIFADEFIPNPRLCYYGNALFRKLGNDERYKKGCNKLNAMDPSKKAAFVERHKKDSDNQYKNAIRELVPEYELKDEKTIYYILALLSGLRQSVLHDSLENTGLRSWHYRLANVLSEDALAVLRGIYTEKINSLNEFEKTAAKSNLRFLFNALGARRDKEKCDIAVSFYTFSIHKAYKNTGFSIRQLREEMLKNFAGQLCGHQYDSVRGKLYQLIDFLIWDLYNKNEDRAKEFVDSLRAEIKRDKDEKSPLYTEQAQWVWQKLNTKINYISGQMIAIQHFSKEDKKGVELSTDEKSIIKKALDSAKDKETGRPIRIGAGATDFTKLIYLLTLFLDGKEINDLLTTLINCFDEINSFNKVIRKLGLYSTYCDDYKLFEKSADVCKELRDVNSFARMTKISVTGKPCMFRDAAFLFGLEDTEDTEEYLKSHLYDKETLPRKKVYNKKTGKLEEKTDTGFRNFIISNVLNSARFRYVVRYGNPQKVREIMQNKDVIRFVLNGIPEDQINRYADNILRKPRESLDKNEKIEELTNKLYDLSFTQFEKVDQSTNLTNGKNANSDKAQFCGLISLYLNVIYQIIKNMVYINSRYAYAFARHEHDMVLFGIDPENLKDPKKNNQIYWPLTNLFINNEDSTLNGRAKKYLSNNIDNSNWWIVKEFRNSVDHLNAVRNMNDYISDLKKAESYFGIYHYVIQRALHTAYKNGNMNPKVLEYFELVNKHNSYSKDFVKALCVPFGYNLPRYKNLTIDALFDRNDKREKTKENVSMENG